MSQLIKTPSSLTSYVYGFGHELDTVTQMCAGDPIKAVSAHATLGCAALLLVVALGGPLVGVTSIAVIVGAAGLTANSALVSVRYKKELEAGTTLAPAIAPAEAMRPAPPKGQNCGNCVHGISGVCAQDGLAISAAETCGSWAIKPIPQPTYTQAIAPLPVPVAAPMAAALIASPPPAPKPTMSDTLYAWHAKFQTVLPSQPTGINFTWAQIIDATGMPEAKAIPLMGGLEEKWPLRYAVDSAKQLFTVHGDK